MMDIIQGQVALDYFIFIKGEIALYFGTARKGCQQQHISSTSERTPPIIVVLCILLNIMFGCIEAI